MSVHPVQEVTSERVGKVLAVSQVASEGFEIEVLAMRVGLRECFLYFSLVAVPAERVVIAAKSLHQSSF